MRRLIDEKTARRDAGFLTSVIAWIYCPAAIKSSSFTRVRGLLRPFNEIFSLVVISNLMALTRTTLSLLHSISLGSITILLHFMTPDSITVALKFMTIATEPITVMTV